MMILKVDPSYPERQISPPDEPTKKKVHGGKNPEGILYHVLRGRLKMEKWRVWEFLQKERRQGP